MTEESNSNDFHVTWLSPRLCRLTEFTGKESYLALGSATGAVINTGSGAGDLYTMIRSLTKKPIIVLLTGGRTEFIAGTQGFDVVYLNRRDTPLLPRHAERFLPMCDGTRFDLGGLHITMRACPGDTPGSMAAYLEEEHVRITDKGMTICDSVDDRKKKQKEILP